MKKIQEHPLKKWEVSITAFTEGGRTRFKVTRRLPELSVAETKMFFSEQEAVTQFEAWLE